MRRDSTIEESQVPFTDEIKKQGLKTLSGLETNSDTKQKRSKALPLGESMTFEAQPISFAVGG